MGLKYYKSRVNITAQNSWIQHESRKRWRVWLKLTILIPLGNESKVSIDESKKQASNPKRYISKKTYTKNQVPELEADTDFKGRCSELEGYVFNIWMIESEKFASKMKELKQYLGTTYSNIC